MENVNCGRTLKEKRILEIVKYCEHKTNYQQTTESLIVQRVYLLNKWEGVGKWINLNL